MDKRVRAVLMFLDLNYSQPIRCHEIAAKTGISLSRLEHLFKWYMHQSIRSYVQQRRLEKAAHLLLTTSTRVSEVANAVGLNHISNFTHAFTKAYGMSPRAYRATARTQSFVATLDQK